MVIYSSNYFPQIEFTGADVPILSSGQNWISIDMSLKRKYNMLNTSP
jgi:hypothetical protein